MQKLGKKNVNHALLAKTVEPQRVERVETHFKDDKNQAGRQKAEDDDDFNENPRVPQEFRVKRVYRGEQRNRVGQQKAPTDVVQQGRGAGGGTELGWRKGFAVQRCARYGRKR